MASQPPPSRSQQQQRTQEQSRNAPPAEQTQTTQAPEIQTERAPATKAKFSNAPGPKLEEGVVTAGRAGERNIYVDMIPVPLTDCDSAYFIVKTAPGNSLEVTMQQLEYKRNYTGTGTLQTQLIPNAPIGTKGTTFVRDTTSGETLERPWKWHLKGGGGSGKGFWETVKGMFIKSEG